MPLGEVIMKTSFRLLLVFALVLSFVAPTLADTVRLKDGSIIRGQVIGFREQQFTIMIGGSARGRRGQTTVYAEDVESIEFDSNTGPTDTASNTTAPTNSQPTRPNRPPDERVNYPRNTHR